MSDGLFDMPPTAPPEAVKLSADRRRTIRQTQLLAAGWHPLGRRLHADAAPADDRQAPGRRCGNCFHRTPAGGRHYPKCMLNPSDVTNGPATDCRGWWPGCAAHTPATPPEGDWPA